MIDPERKDFIFRSVNTPHQFSYENGVTVTHVEPGRAEGVLEVGPNSINPHGNVHGGALATLADTVGGWAVYFATGKPCVTVNYAFSFLRPALGTNKKLCCRAVPEKLGGKLCVYRQTITDDNGVEVANGNFTFYLTDYSGEKKSVPPADA